MTKSKNFITQILSVILFAFTLSGLDVDPSMTATQIVDSIQGGTWLQFLTVILLNLGNTIFQWVRTLRTDPKKFWLFLRSTNWWTSLLNISVAATGVAGITLPNIELGSIVSEIAVFAADGKWVQVVTVIVVNVVNILIHRFVKKDRAT